MTTLNMGTDPSDRYAAIRRALAAGYPELADAIDSDSRCAHCRGYMGRKGYSVDLETSCLRCAP